VGAGKEPFAALFEPIVGLVVRNGLPGFLEPAGPDIGLGVELRDVRLDVQKRGPVEDVHVPDIQQRALIAVCLSACLALYRKFYGC